MRHSLFILTLLCGPPAFANTYLFDNVSVVPVLGPEAAQVQDVLVVDGQIQSIVSETAPPENATVIDGAGLYLMPGLGEMHAHIPPTTQPDSLEQVLTLYLANGITTARGMLGGPGHLKIREAQRSGDLVGPRIYTSGPSMNGNSVKSPDDGRTKVQAYHEAGYDLLKIHPGLSLAEYNAIAEEANRLGIPFAGHVPAQVGAWQALAVGQASVDHLDGFVEALTPADTLGGLPPSFFNYLAAPHAKAGDMPKLLQALKDNEVWVVPTESLMHRFAGLTSVDELLANPDLRYVSLAARRNWEQQVRGALADPNYSRKAAQAFLELRLEMIKAIHEQGHGVLLGSDAPQTFQIPGFSVHDELALYVRAGLTPQEALQTGTSNVARYFGVAGRRGEVKAGYDADLVLVGGNPLNDIAHAADVRGVMVAGRWHDAAWRKRALQGIADSK